PMHIFGPYTNDVTLAMGCGSGTLCTGLSAPPISTDCCIAQGAKPVSITSPGGFISTYFLYGSGGFVATPNTPTLSFISPSSGPQAGGNAVTFTGANFIPGGHAGTVFGVETGTTFTFINQTTGTTSTATSVSCASTTTCTALVPAGLGGFYDVQVQTVCPVASPVPGCDGHNARPSVSIPSTTKFAYAYAGM